FLEWWNELLTTPPTSLSERSLASSRQRERQRPLKGSADGCRNRGNRCWLDTGHLLLHSLYLLCKEDEPVTD
ncbi:hypothetical protein PFISCL1PPCAC_8581, partial [Pristionchus fissidentatus]